MAELAFPAVATLALVLVAIPLATLASKMVLVAMRYAAAHARRGSVAPGLREAGSTLRYLLLVAPVTVPVVWLVSAAIHHAEEEEAALACLFDHVSEGVCSEPLMIAGVVALALAASFSWRRYVATRAVALARPAHDPIAEARVARARAGHPRLASIFDRVRLVEGDEIRTVGLVGARIELGVSVARALDEEALVGALLHEDEHVRGLDPLRFVLASVGQSLNPFAFLLADELVRWRAGREAACDAAAVHRGADPCGLAAALVAVARPPASAGAASAHLGRGGGMMLLRLRVALLMDYVQTPPRCHCARTAPKLAASLVVLLAALPHFCGERVLVDLHRGAERAAVAAFISE